MFEINHSALEFECTLLYSTVTLRTKEGYSTGEFKGLGWSSVSFTPHLALSVMENNKKVDKRHGLERECST